MDENISSGSAFAWLLAIAFVPYLAIPAFLVFGGRKFASRARRKGKIEIEACELPPPNAELDNVAESMLRLVDVPAACGGNKVELITDGVKSFHAVMQLIEDAKESINICTFILSRDEVAHEVVAALTRKARAGVKVRLLIDSVGSFWTRGPYLDELREAGGEIAWFMSVFPTRRRWSANLRNHRKLFLFDHCKAVVGGRNIGSEYLGPEPDPERWVDFTMVVEGPALYQLSQVFAADWEFAAHQKAEDVLQRAAACDFRTPGDIALQTIASGPDVPGDPLYESLLTAMVQSRRRIWIITPYLVPDETILNTLCVLSKIGRDVQILVPQKTDLRLVDFARRYPLRELHRAGAQIWLYQPSMVHAKLMIVDDHTAVTGSANLDHRSLYFNFEITVNVYSQKENEELEAWFLELKEKCIPYSRREARRLRGPLENMMENVSRLLSPLL